MPRAVSFAVGRKIYTTSEEKPAGTYTVEFDAKASPHREFTCAKSLPATQPKPEG